MIKLRIPLFLALVCLSSFFSCKGGAVDITDNSVIWYNTFTGQKLKHVFKIKNTYNKDMIIGQIRPSCPSCIYFDIKKLKIAPGESENLYLTFDTLGYVGKKEFKVLIYHNLAKNGLPIEYSLTAYIRNYVFSSPMGSLNLGTIVYPSEERRFSSTSLILRPQAGTESFKIEKIDKKYDFVEYKIVNFKNGYKIEFKLDSKKVLDKLGFTVEQLKKIYTGEVNGVPRPIKVPEILQENSQTKAVFPIKIYLDHKKQKFIRYVASCTIIGPVDTTKSERDFVFKNVIAKLSKGGYNKSQSIEFFVHSKDKSAFNITKLSTDNPVVSADMIKVSNSRYKVTLTFNKDKKLLKTLKNGRGNLFIETDNPYSKLIAMSFNVD
jgi:hypothetical protein